MGPLDLDLPAAWPQELRRIASREATMPGCVGSRTSELEPPADTVDAIDEVVRPLGIVAFHCSRLLDVEVDDIRRNGLRSTSEELLRSKLAGAVRSGHLTVARARALLDRSVILTDAGQRKARNNDLCLLTIRRTLDIEGHEGLARFLAYWGGEMTYWSAVDGGPEHDALRTIGRPTVVVVALHLAASALWQPPVANLVIGRWRGLEDCAGMVHLDMDAGATLPVLEVWQPGNPEYDRHRALPRN